MDHVVVILALEFVRVPDLDCAVREASANGLLIAVIDFHMDHVMDSFALRFVVVVPAVEDQVPRQQVLHRGVTNGKGVKLVGLVPPTDLKPEVWSQVLHHLADQPTTVQEEGGMVVLACQRQKGD